MGNAASESSSISSNSSAPKEGGHPVAAVAFIALSVGLLAYDKLYSNRSNPQTAPSSNAVATAPEVPTPAETQSPTPNKADDDDLGIIVWNWSSGY